MGRSLHSHRAFRTRLVYWRCGSSVHCHGACWYLRGGVAAVCKVLASKIIRQVSALHLASVAVLIGVRHALDACARSLKRSALKVADTHERRLARFGAQYDLALVGQKPGGTDFGLLSCGNSGRGRRRGRGGRSRWLLGGVRLKKAPRLANNSGCCCRFVKRLDCRRWLARC